MSLFEQLQNLKKATTPQKTAKIVNGSYELSFKYDPDVIAQIKTIMGRKWDLITKIWTVPLNPYSQQKLEEFGFEVEKINLKKINLDFEKGLKLFPFQEEGVKGIERFNGRALLADEMGLGKTIQAIGYIKMHPEFKNILIICPAGLKYNWRREIKKWLNIDSHIISGKRKYALKENINIINYEILSEHEKEIMKSTPDIMICDESQYCKNYKAIRTKCVIRMSKKINKVVFLSGTPITSRPREFYTPLNILLPDTFNNFPHFANRYCDPKSNGFAIEYNGASNTEELHQILINTCMIRRLKTDVAKDLPEKMINTIVIENDGTYDSSLEYEQKRKSTFEIKKPHIIEWVNNFLESKDKLVIMADRIRAIDFIMENYPEISVKVDGRTSQKQKQEAIDRFQNDPKIKIFVGNITAAGVGITLTSADSELFIEYDSVPGRNLQAEDRVHRIGQKSTCFIYYMMVENTVDSDIVEKIEYKRKGIEGVMNGFVNENGLKVS